MDCEVVEIWCHTQVKVVKLLYTWTINNFSFCEADTVLASSTFSANDDVKWCLKLHPQGQNTDSKEHLSLFLRLVSSNRKEVCAKYKFWLVNVKQAKTNIFESGRAYRFSEGKSWGFHQFFRRDQLTSKANSLLPDDKLTIVCEIAVVGDTVNVAGQSSSTTVQVTDCQQCGRLEVMLDSTSFSDVVLCAGGREFHAHKAILAAQSDVFSAMFEHNMEETKHSRVEIADIDSDIMLEMLRFVYTGKAPSLDTTAASLLAAADKYALERLKVMCEEALCANLSVKNVSEILVLADLHSAEQLKARAIDYISRYAKDVMTTPGWKGMIKSHGHLVADLFCASLQIPPVRATEETLQEEEDDDYDDEDDDDDDDDFDDDLVEDVVP